ncbi:Phosphoribosylamine--glycine ligase [hydrothermal vent metagenome]|uniref:Phosphoribosylamine--glycine ligase n=1 Tax=hydrothermal vent metagenome TaxID=652676 RepID=A0A3B1B8G1_9ZZZZ
MKVLIIGGGGREHALAWKAAQSSRVTEVFVAPGNAGTALETKINNIDIAADDVSALLQFAKSQNIGMTIVGPEAPLVLGLVDQFQQASLACFGPSQAAAQLEGSKTFSKEFLARHNIPSAAYQSFTEIDAAIHYIKSSQFPLVIKADGLAAGKGVIIAENQQQAIAAVQDMLADNRFGEAGQRVVIEEFLTGEEASFIVMVDGKHVLPLASSQDHKAAYNGDTGPNTGGMGAYSPAPVVTQAMHQSIMDKVIMPTVIGMAAEGTPYTGFLYAGVMIGADEIPKVLEFNCRFGDPETQPIMMRLKSDLVEMCQAAIDQKLDTINADWDPRAAVGVVLAAGGYPNDYKKGNIIQGLSDKNSDSQKIFHAGTSLKDQHVITSGGRVLCAVGLGNSVSEAQQTAYNLVKTINWDGIEYRDDIGYRAVAREQAN